MIKWAPVYQAGQNEYNAQEGQDDGRRAADGIGKIKHSD